MGERRRELDAKGEAFVAAVKEELGRLDADDELGDQRPPPGRHDARAFVPELLRVPWRVGRSVGRTVYAVLDPREGGDVLIGLFDSRELAEAAVAAHNLTVGVSPAQG